MTYPRLIIFDLDNTLYREPPEMQLACEEAMAKAVSAMVPELSYEEALVISKESNHQTGSVGSFFTERYDLDRRQLHDLYHDDVDHLILPQCERTKEAFAQIDRDLITLGLLTHSSMDWSRRVLKHLELTEFFHPALIVPVEDVGFQGKFESEVPFTHLMDKASVLRGEEIDPGHTVMVEDLPKNLTIAHAMGIKTVLVHHGSPAPEADYIDEQFENVTAMIKNFIA